MVGGIKICRSLLVSVQVDISLGLLPSSRLLFCTLCILTGSHSALSTSQLLNSGVLALAQTVLRLAGRQAPDEIASTAGASAVLGSVLVEEKGEEELPATLDLSGPDLAKLMKIGTRVVRGRDWKWQMQVRKARQCIGVCQLLANLYIEPNALLACLSMTGPFLLCSVTTSLMMRFVQPSVLRGHVSVTV